MFERKKYNKIDPTEIRSFHLTQPEERISSFIFKNQRSTVYDSIANQATFMAIGKNEPSKIPPVDQNNKVLTREIDHTVRRAHRVVELEMDRVQKHTEVRNRQIEIEKEARVVLLLREKSEKEKEKALQLRMNEENEMKASNFDSVHKRRNENHTKA